MYIEHDSSDEWYAIQCLPTAPGYFGLRWNAEGLAQVDHV